MGVPAFFRWLSRKYPSVIVHCVEQKPVDVNGVSVPNDTSEPNPNGMEFDNLYLDMNGIIHPCTHPEDGTPAPKNEDEMMVAIFNCIDKLFNIVRPRKVLYMAIDGVAPRAKMNQQRSRRFRASKESVEKLNEIKRIRAELLLKGVELPPEKPKEEHFDSNCITPGTPFMARLSECLHYYIHERLNNDPGWKNIKVVLSDANVPGEGEHKIMDFIRRQRGQPDHDPNTQHVLCGADADLIMLGLATHEPNFTIIREEFKPNQPKPCDICAQIGHETKDCTGGVKSLEDKPEIKVYSDVQYIFVRLNVLKEYLQKELLMPNLPFKYEFERAVDDWVFMCFFVGNDFLPHLPSLEIREGAIDRLVTLYKDCVYRTGGWLTNSGEVFLERVQVIMSELGKVEDEIFKTRQQRELSFKAREKAKKRRSEGSYNDRRPNWQLVKDTQFAPRSINNRNPVQNPRNEAMMIRKAGMHTQVDHQLQTVTAKSSLESMIKPVGSDEQPRGTKRKAEEDEESDDDQAHDEVRLWEDGFKDRYYESKFDVASNNYEFRNSVALHYVRGLCWVLKYYYQGCASWSWYFPYHYAPFASDFVNISGLSTDFDSDTKPFKPLEQLMGVFPAASSKHVPDLFAKLMSDPESTIIDFYPEDFKIDLNGKKFAWQGVALLPFVDEKRLFKALAPLYSQLTDAEKKRNSLGDDRLYVSKGHHGHILLNSLYLNDVSVDMETHISLDGMAGTVLLSDICIEEGGLLNSPVRGLDEVSSNLVCTVKYRYPQYPKGFIFPAKKLDGAIDPPTVLKPSDLNPQQNRQWRAQTGMVPATQRAYLDRPGHRMVNHHLPSFNNVPPPQSMDRRQNNYQQNSYNSRGGHYNSYQNNRGGYSSNRGNYRGGYQQNNSHQGSSRNNYQQQNRNHSYDRNRTQDQDRRPPGPYRDRYQSNNYYGQ